MTFQTQLRFAPLALLALIATTSALAAPPASSAYNTDPQQSYVEDETSKGIQQVNMITCIMAGLRADALVNQGDYLALVDEVKCDQDKSGASSDGSQVATQFLTGAVNASRTSNADPMITKAWLDEDSEDRHTLIYVHISATAGPTLANPYGAFRLDFCGHPMPDTGNGCLMHGMLQGADSGLRYFETEDEGNGPRTIAMNLTTAGTQGGSGEQKLIDGGQAATDFTFAFNDTLFRRSNGAGDDLCFSRDARDPDTGFSVGQYGLYDAETGARVNLNSGFPFNFSTGGTLYHGFMGYGGLSLPPAASDALTTGATVQKIDYTGGQAVTTNYTVVKGEGKLLKYTRRDSTLAQIDHIRFTVFLGFDGSNAFSGAQANSQYEMYWDDSAAQFIVTGQMMCGQNGCQTQAFPSGEQPVTDGAYWSTHGGMQGYSQSLGGEMFVNVGGGSPPYPSSTAVVFRTQDIVYPGDPTVPANLHCVQNCPTAGTLQAYFTGNGSAPSPFVSTTFNNWQPTAAADVVNYTRDPQTGNLLDDAPAPVTMTSRDAFQEHSQYQNGVMSGRLFGTMSEAWCDATQGDAGGFCDNKVSAAQVYYQWQTGPNSYNQFAAVKDGSGDFVHFDAPLQLNYHVPDEAAYGEYAGKDLVLQYGGFGNLWGIPGTCVSSRTNDAVPCDGSEEARYVSSFFIPFDLEKGRVTDAAGSQHTPYLVKWLNREIRFARKSHNTCLDANLNLPTNVVLPTANDLQDPSDPNSAIYIGVRPTVTGAPRVIQGVVEY